MMEADSDIYDSERLKWKLISDHKEKELEEILDGEEINNEYGSLYKLTTDYQLNVSIPDKKEAEKLILKDFQLIEGVGVKTERKLKESGDKDLFDLSRSGRYEEKVEEIIEDLEKKRLDRLQERYERWHNMSDPNCFKLMGFFDKEQFTFFDIETMGLRYRPAFLIGVGNFTENGFRIEQYLARDLKEEKSVVWEFLSELDEEAALVSFNGRSFDSRFIKERMDVLDIDGDIERPHFDLLHICKGFIDDAPDFKLKSLEEHIFDKKRKDDVSSAMVPNFYQIYLKKDNPGPLIPIIKHNKEDIKTLALLVDYFYEKSSP